MVSLQGAGLIGPPTGGKKDWMDQVNALYAEKYQDYMDAWYALPDVEP